MKNILFLTAYSEHSKDIFRYALKLAQEFGAGITLCHIYNDLFSTNQEVEHRIQLEKLKSFARENTSLLKQMVPLTFKVKSGDLLNEILEIEQTLPADLIVMGMKRNIENDRVFGRLSLKVLKESNTPVLLIPPDSKMEEIEKIIYATYLSSADDEKAIHSLIGWSKAFDASINVLNICNKHQSEKAKLKLAELQNNISKAKPNLPIQYQLEEGNTTQMIEKYSTLTQADLLVLSTHRSGLWAQLFEPSVTEQIANETLIPLLVLKN